MTMPSYEQLAEFELYDRKQINYLQNTGGVYYEHYDKPPVLPAPRAVPKSKTLPKKVPKNKYKNKGGDPKRESDSPFQPLPIIVVHHAFIISFYFNPPLKGGKNAELIWDYFFFGFFYGKEGPLVDFRNFYIFTRVRRPFHSEGVAFKF